MDANTTVATRRGRGRPKKSQLTAEQLLDRCAVLNMAEFCQILGMDPTTAFRKERAGQIPPRRMLAGKLSFITSEVRAWMSGAPVATGVDPDRSRRSREIALARNAGRAA